MTPPRKRLYRYDVLRVAACISVIIYHFEYTALQRNEIPTGRRTLIGWSINFLNLNLGSIAVFTFLLLAGFMRAKELEVKHLNMRAYYKKRIARLFIPFYLSYFLVLIYRLSLGYTKFNVPGNRIILTILGLDGYASSLSPSHPIRTFTLVGEWFFGAFVIVTLTWPLVRIPMRKWPIQSLLCAIALECAAPIALSYTGESFRFARLPTTCITTFMLGATIGAARRRQQSKKTAPTPYIYIGLAILALSFFIPANPILDILHRQALTAGILTLVTFVQWPQSLKKPLWLSNPTDFLSGRLIARGADLSFYAFMFQRQAIQHILNPIRSSINSTYGVFDYYALMLTTIGLSFLVAFIVNQLEKQLRISLSKPSAALSN